MEYRRDSYDVLSPFETKLLTDLRELNIFSDVEKWYDINSL